MTQIQQRFPDVPLVWMIVTLTHTIVKLPLGQLCWWRLSSLLLVVKDVPMRVSIWLWWELPCWFLNQVVRRWTWIIPMKSTTLPSQLLLLIEQSRILDGRTAGRWDLINWYFRVSTSHTFKGPLDGYVQESSVVWTGEGTWSPKSICYDWDKEANRVFVCTFPDGTSLSNGQEAVGSCAISDSLDCP